ncbi:MAG: methylmalonyl-CoA epimerase [Bacteroidetes bacterium]|jgi:methylmalonyl-CoA/ethylmalonyl-CoA epimerase|nr:methylmalonyl-CoA epimerase [Bacteroidota bacterium]MDA0879073.1 methylmalonyl-CoA epimerase [Bacteroidota bacterium]MDA1116168.1 methylmalonyl-CoA epimerase [Bacteroidota bacterium]
MLGKIEHIGIAVKDLEAANELYGSLLGVIPYKQENVPSEGVTTSFFQTGDSKVELLMATDPNSPIAKFIEKRGEGLHHLAFAVEDIDQEVQRLVKAGFQVLNEQPKLGADNKRIVFLHPKGAHGVLVELCQEIS